MVHHNEKVQFVGSGIMGCPFVKGNSQKLEYGTFYFVKATKEEAGMLILSVSDLLGKSLGWYPAQWFNPMNHPTVPTN